jgi:heat shock protein HslJ
MSVASLIIAVAICQPGTASAQGTAASWLDRPRLEAWNKPGAPVPPAPKSQGTPDPRCRAQARPPVLNEDKLLRDQGWDLVGAYQGGWQMVVLRGTAGYDGMCRPRRYQDFVFVRGTFAGTLSPQPMESRIDGAVGRVSLQSNGRLSAEYARYTTVDPLCCPSRATTVVFEIVGNPAVVRPVSASTFANQVNQPPGPVVTDGRVGAVTADRQSAAAPTPGLAGTSWQLVTFRGGDGATLVPDDRAKYTIEFAADGRLAARIDCNRGRGAWKSSGSNQLELGPLALTRASCPAGSLHDQLVKQWSNLRSYVIRNGHLFLALMADGGTYEFEPVPKPSR